MASLFRAFNAVAGQNVLGRPTLVQRNLGMGGGGGVEGEGGLGENPDKFWRFLFLKLLQMRQILNTNSYIWGSKILMSFSLHNY